MLGSFRRIKHRPTLLLAASGLAALALCMLLFVFAPLIWIAVAAALAAGASCLVVNSVTRAVRRARAKCRCYGPVGDCLGGQQALGFAG